MTKKDETAVAVKKSLKPEVQELSDKILKGLELSKDEGIIAETKSNYLENLPEGVTPDVDASLSDYRTKFVAASAHAVGVIAGDALHNKKKLDTVTAELMMGPHDVVRHSVERTKDYVFGSGAERKTITKVGVITTEVDVKGGHNSGQLKTARFIVGQLISEKLAK